MHFVFLLTITSSYVFPASSSQYKKQMSLENRQSHTLFGVAALFLSGHLLRVILNLHELVHGLHSRLTAHDEDGCGEMPVNFPPWAL